MRPLRPFELVQIFAFLSLCPTAARAKVVEGVLETHKDWIFLTRFCFYNGTGMFEFNISYPEEFAPQKLLLYYDDLWPLAYKTGKTCKEKTELLRVEKLQILSLIPGHNGCRRIVEPASPGSNRSRALIKCSQKATFDSQRERWWYVVMSNCDAKKGLKMEYRFSLTNNNETAWLTHFSADEFYILHADIVFCVLYILLVLASCYQSYILHSRHLLHATYKLFLMSVFAHFAGIVFLVAFYADYASEGLAADGLKFTGRGLLSISRVLFLLLLVLLAKGYTVTRARLKPSTSARIAVFMTMYAVIYACLFFYEQMYFDSAEVLYTYESPIGYGLIALSMAAMCWFIYSVWHTARLYPTKKTFFVILLVMYCVWFISLPIVVLVATHLIPKFRREKIVNAVDLMVAFRAHFFFMILTWPAKFNRIFPYHVRTTQIDAMSKVAGGRADGSTLDNFAHYQYAPSGNMVATSFGKNDDVQSLSRRTSVHRQSISRFNMKTSHAAYDTENMAMPTID